MVPPVLKARHSQGNHINFVPQCGNVWQTGQPVGAQCDNGHDNVVVNRRWQSPLSSSVCFIDWAEVGVSDGVSDLTQYMIAHVPISIRRRVEKALLHEYWETLVSSPSQSGRSVVDKHEFTFEMCLARYKRGGIERWLQVLSIMAAVGIVHPDILSDDVMQLTHDRVEAFLHDHCSAQNTTYVSVSAYDTSSFW